MTDRDLAQALRVATELQAEARAYWERVPKDDLPERDAASMVVRHAEGLKTSLQRWLGARAMRVQLGKDLGGGSRRLA